MEERLKFYETGDLPRKNVDVMNEAVEEVADEVVPVESWHRSRPASGMLPTKAVWWTLSMRTYWWKLSTRTH